MMGKKGIFVAAILAVGIALAGGVSPPLVVPYPPGGPADVAPRLVTQPLSARLGQSVIVGNQPGGRGGIAPRRETPPAAGGRRGPQPGGRGTATRGRSEETGARGSGRETTAHQ